MLGVSDNGLEPIVDIKIVNDRAAEHQRILHDAEAASDDSQIPGTTTVRVETLWTLLPSVGMCDPKAGAKLSFDLSSVGYGMSKRGKVYHRPDCIKLPQKNLIYSLDPTLEGERELRKPCQKCRPQDWDAEFLPEEK